MAKDMEMAKDMDDEEHGVTSTSFDVSSNVIRTTGQRRPRATREQWSQRLINRGDDH
jgi:hypothetical protein